MALQIIALSKDSHTPIIDVTDIKHTVIKQTLFSVVKLCFSRFVSAAHAPQINSGLNAFLSKFRSLYKNKLQAKVNLFKK